MSVETREMKEIEAAVEGILFASGEPVHIDRICLAAELDRPTAELVLQKLMDYYSFERRGMRLLRLEDSWQLCSAPEYADVIRRAFEIRKPAKLSQPALEVLTIIAYYQPTTRAYVDPWRGQLLYRGAAAGPAPYRGVRAAAGAGKTTAVPHHQSVPPGVPPELAGGSAGDAGDGGRRPAASGGGRLRAG